MKQSIESEEEKCKKFGDYINTMRCNAPELRPNIEAVEKWI